MKLLKVVDEILNWLDLTIESIINTYIIKP